MTLRLSGLRPLKEAQRLPQVNSPKSPPTGHTPMPTTSIWGSQNRLKIASNFNLFFGPLFKRFWVAKMVPKGLKNRPKTLLEASCRWELFSDDFGKLFRPPGTRNNIVFP